MTKPHVEGGGVAVRTPTVLVLDTAISVRQMRRVFASRGMEIVGASTKAEAMAAIKGRSIDVAMVEAHSPALLSTYADLVGALERRKPPAAIIYTSFSDLAQFGLGDDALVLEKPYALDVLFETIRDLGFHVPKRQMQGTAR